MVGDPNIRTPTNGQRINVNREHEVSYWSQKLGVTPEQLLEAVKSVGPMADAVKQYVRGGTGTGHWREKSVG